jgi:serine/threonine protein kinase
MARNPQRVETLVQQSPHLRGCTVQRRLGEGGMGITYLLDDANGAKLVLKMIKDAYAADKDARVRFVREMKHTRELSHPNIVALFDSGEHAGTLFYTMEYCASGNAHDFVEKSSGKLPPERAIPIIMDMLAGLAFAHNAPVSDVKLRDGKREAGRGIVHRDIKPENILLVAPDGPAKVADLGLAKAFEFAGLSGVTGPGAHGGTIAFQPRQQVKSFLYAKADVDVWAAAASLYYMLTGTYTRDFVDGVDPVATVRNTAPIPIRQRNPEIPPALADVIDSALDDAGEVLPYQSAMDLQDALRTAAPS